MINVYSIRDSKSGLFAQPFFMTTHAYAIRAFGDLANDPTTLIGKHPEDFSLYCLCQFDDVNGEFIEPSPSLVLATALSLKANNDA